MDHWIEHVDEPERLILAWQAPVDVPDRRRWAVGVISQGSAGVEFRYYDDDELEALNEGRNSADLRDAGYLGYPAFELGSSVYIHGVLEAFMRRLPPPGRADFAKYLEHFRLQSATPLSPLALLGATEARLPGDGFSLIDPLNPNSQRRELVFEIAGHRHYAAARDRLRVGQELRLVADLANAHDPNAVSIDAEGARIGYVNRLQAPTFRGWLRDRRVSAWLLRLNGTRERPRAFVFVQVRPNLGLRAA